MKMNYKDCRGFTIIELAVVVAITLILSSIILVSVKQYVGKGKDASVSANLAVLIPSGEAYYNINGYSYANFCTSTVMQKIKDQIPNNPSGKCVLANPPQGVCCNVNGTGDAWAACATQFADTAWAFCVDSRGVKKPIDNGACSASITVCP